MKEAAHKSDRSSVMTFSVPESLMKQMEDERWRRRMKRSELVQEALRHYFATTPSEAK